MLIILSIFLLFGTNISGTLDAELVPDWIKKTAKWFGDDKISETEFLNAIKFLIENDIIILDTDSNEKNTNFPLTSEVVIPNGNAEQANTGFYIPLNLIVRVNSTVVWVNDDNVLHTIQSQDKNGKPNGLFNSNVLKTGERFAFKFEEAGTYNYYCTLHPWRVGSITVK